MMSPTRRLKSPRMNWFDRQSRMVFPACAGVIPITQQDEMSR